MLNEAAAAAAHAPRPIHTIPVLRFRSLKAAQLFAAAPTNRNTSVVAVV